MQMEEKNVHRAIIVDTKNKKYNKNISLVFFLKILTFLKISTVGPSRKFYLTN